MSIVKKVFAPVFSGCENPDCDETTCKDCCPHDERDHGICMDCEDDANGDPYALSRSRNE